MRWVGAVVLLGVLGCAGDTGLWIRVEAPLVVPTQCDGLDVTVQRAGGGTAAFTQSYGLDGSVQFPLTVSLSAPDSQDIGPVLTVSVLARKAGLPAAPWASSTVQITLQAGAISQVTCQLCGADAGCGCRAAW